MNAHTVMQGCTGSINSRSVSINKHCNIVTLDIQFWVAAHMLQSVSFTVFPVQIVFFCNISDI